MSLSSPSTALSEFDAEFAQRYEVERARWLRRWFLWYAAIASLLLSFSAAGNMFGILAENLDDTHQTSTLLDLAGDILLIVLYAGAALLIGMRTPDRRWLVIVMTWLIIIASTVGMLVAPLTTYLDTNAGEAWGLQGEMLAFTVGASGLLAAFVLHFLGSLFIALKPSEALRPLLPVAVIFTLTTLLLNPGNLATKFMLIGLFPFMGAPGVLLSWGRAMRFRERFHSREISGRLGEMSLELAYARRIHEALFPAPVDRGAIRLAYRYEPMRDIGGDYLFVHPIAPQREVLDEPVSIVIIDVSGHGVGAALAVNRFHGELTRFFFMHPDGSPGELLRALNAYAHVALAPQGVFASAIALRIDPLAHRVTWANAGHPPAVVRRSDGSLDELGSTAILLGVVDERSFDADEQNAPFAIGDVVVAYTDGLIESRDEQREHFGMDRLLTSIQRHARQSQGTGHLAKQLADDVRKFRKGEVTDDLLIVEAFLAPDDPAH